MTELVSSVTGAGVWQMLVGAGVLPACCWLAGPLLLEKIPIYWILGSRALTLASAQKTDTQPTMLYQVDQNKLKTLKVENYAENSNEFDLDPEI